MSAAISNSAHCLATPQTSPAFQGTLALNLATSTIQLYFLIVFVAGGRKLNRCIWQSRPCRRTSSSSDWTGRPALVSLARVIPPRWRSPRPTGSSPTTGSSSSASSPPTSPPTGSWTRTSRRRTRGRWSTRGCTGEQNARLGGRGTASSSTLRPTSFDTLQDSCPPLLMRRDSRRRMIILAQFFLNLLAKSWHRSTSTIQTELPDQHLTNKYITYKTFLSLQYCAVKALNIDEVSIHLELCYV